MSTSTTIQYRIRDGCDVSCQGAGAPPLPFRHGYATTTVDTIPPGPGRLAWQPDDPAHPEGPGQLVRIAPPPAPVPTLTPEQARRWLNGAGITLAAVQAQIDAIADPLARDAAQTAWEYGPLRHGEPLVLQIGAALGLTPAQIIDAFRAAAAAR